MPRICSPATRLKGETTTAKDYDLLILGQGSAAFAAAIKADELGVKTAMVGGKATPGAAIGGTCVNVGCMPSKRLITVGTLFYNAAKNPLEGISYGTGNLDFERIIQEKDALVRRFRKDKYADVLKNLKNVTYHQNKGRFVSKSEVKAGREILGAEKFLIATGARASVPAIKGLEEIKYLTNEEALSLKELPRSLCVIGGRTLGLEFAQMFAQFGTRVTVLQRSERILPDDEPEISEALTRYLEEVGVHILTKVKIEGVGTRGKSKIVHILRDDFVEQVTCDQVLLATGRRPNTEYLNLDNVGVKTDDAGFVVVDDQMKTSAPNIWAAGDVTGEPMLETIAAKEGSVAVNNAFTPNKRRINFTEVPSAVFTYPEVARVGLTEAEVNDKGIKCSCGTLSFDLVPKAHVIGDTRGLVKLIVNRENKQILGVHILAPHAADMIHEGVLAVKNELTIDDIIDTVHVFPTLSESIKLAAQSFYVDVGKMSCCVE